MQGKTYEIEVFEVFENEHSYRPSRHPLKITFNAHTTFTEIVADIPKYSFCPMDIDQILQMPDKEDIKYLIGQTIPPIVNFK